MPRPTHAFHLSPRRLPPLVKSLFQTWMTEQDDKKIRTLTQEQEQEQQWKKPLGETSRPPKNDSSTASSSSSPSSWLPWSSTNIKPNERQKRKNVQQQQQQQKQSPSKQAKRQKRPKVPRQPVETGQVCRVVTLSDGMIPTNAIASQHLQQEPHVLRKLDDIYHSMSHEETRRLRYMDRPDAQGIAFHDGAEEEALVTVVRNSLQDAGFELLTQRDLDLCDALNAGYLLRLSIVPDVKDLDPGLAREFYPEWFSPEDHSTTNVTGTMTTRKDDLLFDGKVLIYWRGYDTEVTRGRLLLAKLDYLQTKLVQSAAVAVKTRLEAIERLVGRSVRQTSRAALAWSVGRTRAAVDAVPLLQAVGLRRKLRQWRPSAAAQQQKQKQQQQQRLRQQRQRRNDDSFFQLARYGGSKQRILGNDPLEPFLIYDSDAQEFCSVTYDDSDFDDDVVDSKGNDKTVNGRASMATTATGSSTKKTLDSEEQNGEAPSAINGISTNTTDAFVMDQTDEEFYECINHSELRCPYDQHETTLPPMQLLRRVSMNNVVDLFSRQGRRNLISSLFAKTELVEPTYKEVVVIWRNKQPEPKRRFQPPQFVYDVADLFDLEGLEPPKPLPPPKPQPLEIRTFDGTPLANLMAVFPKTKLVFRPADAFVFDLISIVSLGLVVSSQRFDNAKLDILALVSGTVWLVRLAIRYSNKLARYDLLVKNFLTSKISHRNAGALKYLAAEAGSQRATRAALVHDWLCQLSRSNERRGDASMLYVDWILAEGPSQINELVKNKQVDLDMQAALNDLEDLKLLQVERDGVDGRPRVVVTCAPGAVESRLRQAWNAIFRGGLSLRVLTGRR